MIFVIRSIVFNDSKFALNNEICFQQMKKYTIINYQNFIGIFQQVEKKR